LKEDGKMFTKVYLLSKDEFNLVVSDFFETFSEEYESEIQRREVTEDMVADYLADVFEHFLDEEGMTGIVVYREGRYIEIFTGENFVKFAKAVYGDLVKAAYMVKWFRP
jgi:DNA primase large subunit